MATRSTIAVEYPDGTVRAIYCHWDGYLEGVGATLVEHYADFDQADALINMGDISSLDSTVEGSEFYARDRGEEFVPAEQYGSLRDYTPRGRMEEYNYVRLYKTGEWQVAALYNDRAEGSVKECLAQIENAA